MIIITESTSKMNKRLECKRENSVTLKKVQKKVTFYRAHVQILN